jgi:hypothetical protein
MWNHHRQQQQQPEQDYNSFSSSVPFLLSSRFNLLFTNSPFSGRKKIFKTKSCKNIAANLPDLKKTRQSFAPPKISPSRISQAAKPEEAPGDEARARRRGQKQESQPPAKTRHNYGLAKTSTTAIDLPRQTDRQRKKAPAHFFPKQNKTKIPPKKRKIWKK